MCVVCVYAEVGPQIVDRLSGVVCPLRAFNEMCFKMEARFEHLFNEPSKRRAKHALPYATYRNRIRQGCPTFKCRSVKLNFRLRESVYHRYTLCWLHYSMALTLSRNKNAFHRGFQSFLSLSLTLSDI